MKENINAMLGIEGIPLITRFKTPFLLWLLLILFQCIEGIPLITRFKTFSDKELHSKSTMY